MKGKVRTREKCPKCGEKFHIVEEIGIYCPECKTYPRTYYIFLYWQGNKYRISRDPDGHILDSYKRAHRLLELIRLDIDKGIFSPANYLPKEIEQFRGKNLFPKWLKTKNEKSPTYIRELNRYVNQFFLPYFEQTDLRKITAGDIEDFYHWLPQNLSLKTKKNIMDALKNFLLWLYQREAIARVPSIPKISPPEPPIYIITREAQIKILDCMDVHHRPIFHFLMLHPVRPGEARALKVKDFDFEKMVVHIERTIDEFGERKRKNKKDYYLPVSPEFDLSILKNRFPDEYVFLNKAGRPYHPESMRKIWHRARKKAGIPEISMYHGTRHSWATDRLKQGFSLEMLSKALGHADRASVEKYAKHDVELLRGMFETNVRPLRETKGGGSH